MRWILLISLFCWSCSGDHSRNQDATLAHLKDSEVKSFLEKVFQAHGGLERWNALASLKYYKDYTLYKEDGSAEKSAKQFHHYNYYPETLIKIVSKSGEDSKRLVLDNGKLQETINGTVNLEADPSVLQNQLQSSLFVIGQPFKLADQGVKLSYEGVQTIKEKRVHVLKAVYDPSTQLHHTTPDTWWLYFEEQSYLLNSYLVQHLDHFSLVENLKTIKVDGFTFPAERKSYRVDDQQNILYLRADYFYQDFEVIEGN